MFYLPRIIAVMLLLGTLQACGQKGPLFLTPQSVPYSPFSSNSAPSLIAPATTPSVTPPASPASAAK